MICKKTDDGITGLGRGRWAVVLARMFFGMAIRRHLGRPGNGLSFI